MRNIVTALALAAGISSLGIVSTALAEAAATPEPATAPVVDEATLAALKQEGTNIYFRNCQSCHAPGGAGGAGPALANSSAMENSGEIIRQTIFGGSYMPPMGALSDRDIAAVLTYIRTSWGNDFGAIAEEEVAAAR